MTTRIGSLCSGYEGLGMGLAHGLAARGEDAAVVWHAEFDKDPSRILAHHWPDVPNYADITTADWSTVEPIDWLCAGYPCQPFSHAGRRKGATDDRHLWPHVARATRDLRPRHVLLENVRGHVSLGLDAVLADLAALGYDTRWGVVRAADIGAPHIRARLFIIATDTARESKRDGLREGRPGVDVRGGRPTDGDSPRIPADTSGDRRDQRRTEPARILGGPHAPLGSSPTVPDTSRKRYGGEQDARGVGRMEFDGHQVGQRERAHHEPRPEPVDRSTTAPPDTDSGGRELIGRELAERRDVDRRDSQNTPWGAYEPAVRQWERITDRPSPSPLAPGRTGPRLNPRFVEWMMGLPDGHVTTPAIGLNRNAQLKALGNGVVPQQAALAVSLLHTPATPRTDQ